MEQCPTHSDHAVARRHNCKLLTLTLMLLGVALALPVGAFAAVAVSSGSWKAENASSAGIDARLSAVDFVNANDGWAVGENTNGSVILVTTNGGATWTAQNASMAGSGAWLGAVDFVNASDGWAVGYNDNTFTAVILATTNGGVTWTAQNASAADSTELLSVSFVDANHGWAVGGSSDSATETFSRVILATSDGGATWAAQEAKGGDSSAWLYAVTFIDGSHGWAVGGNGTILVTTNGGTTWTPQETRGVDSYVELRSVSFIDVNHGWAVGSSFDDTYNAVIFSTSDGGTTWIAQNASSAGSGGGLESVSFVDANHGWAVGESSDVTGTYSSSVILATTNGGYSAPTITALTPASGLVGSSVILTGTNFTGATVVSLNGHPASFAIRSATQIVTRVPSGATSGAIRVTTLGGTATSTGRFTVLIKPTLTLKLSGLTSGALRLGKILTASGKVTPTNLGSKVTLTVQREQSGHWLAVTAVVRTLSTTGTYSWTYKPAKRGAYRIKTTIAKTATHTAATTVWLAFTVK